MKVSNIRLNWRGSVRSQSVCSPGCTEGFRPHSASSSLSARKRSLQVRQSTIGSVKPSTWPEASQVRGMHEDRRVEGHHVVALLQHGPPPLAP